MSDTTDLIDGRFHVQDELGRGGMGVVLRAYDAASDRAVALKYCPAPDEDAQRRFAREVRVMSSIEHRNVMPVLHQNLEHDPPYFTMPLAKQSVQDELEGVVGGDESSAQLDEEEALEVFREICRGIQAIHNAGATHRDIKPANIMRMSDEAVVISDMGLVKLDPRDTTILTQTAAFVGTRIYSAPEQFGGSRDVDERADVYQLGKVLYQLVSGDLPILIDREQLPSGLGYIVERATREQPAQRYQSVGAMMDAIESYVRAKGPEANLGQEYEAAIEEARYLAEDEGYRLENLRLLLALVLRFAEDHNVFLEQFDRLPPDILSVMARRLPAELTSVLDVYKTAIEEEVGELVFAYAETVARKMRAIYVSGNTDLKVLAMRTTMIAAVRLNRYAAMEVFDAMLVQVKDSSDAVPIADMLREEVHHYRRIADRVSRTRLHVAIRAVYDEALGSYNA